MKTTAAYTTANELKFLDSLGLAGLEAYLLAAARRTDWGAMDAQAVQAHCRMRIARIRDKSTRPR